MNVVQDGLHVRGQWEIDVRWVGTGLAGVKLQTRRGAGGAYCVSVCLVLANHLISTDTKYLALRRGMPSTRNV